MRKNRTKKLILICAAVSISILFIITGCSSSASSDNKTKILELTNENVQKVFSENYNVRIKEIDNDPKSIDASFDAKTDIQKSKAKEKLKEIEDTLYKNFNITKKPNNNVINIYVNRDILIGSTYGKIRIGESPTIDIENEYYTYSYSIATKFDLLNPHENTKITANDTEDKDITSKIKLKNPEVLTKIGKQILIYEVIDSDGNVVTSNLTMDVKK